MNKTRLIIIGVSVVAGLFVLLILVSIIASSLNNGQISSGAMNCIFILGLGVVTVGIWYLASLREKPNTFGNAHFASVREIQEAGFNSQEPTSLALGQLKSQIVAIPEKRMHEHVLLVATTGAGKSTGVIIPGLLTEPGTRGVFVNDMKGELYDRTAGAISRHMIARIFSPAREKESVFYNPLAHIEKQEDAEDLAQCWTDNTGISSEPYYNDCSRLLITAAALHLRDTEPAAPFSQLADMLSSTSFDGIRKMLTKSRSDRARSVGAAFINAIGEDPKLAAGIMSGMATRFLVMKNETLRRLTSTNTADPRRNIDFKRLANDPEALFMCIPASDTRRLKPVTALLVMQMMNYLTGQQASNRSFVLYLDELANIGAIPHYSEHISLVRGAGIALVQAIQNFSQLDGVYGKQDAQTIIANSTTKVFYPGMGKPECEFVSQLLGVKTVALPSHTISEDRESHTEGVTRRPLMNADEVRQLQKGYLIIVSGNHPPMLIQNTPYYLQQTLVSLADLPVQELPPATGPTPLLIQNPSGNVWPTP